MLNPTEVDALDRADMERLQTGGESALNSLMERHAPPIFQFIHRMVGNEEDANDLAQETWVRVFKSAGSFHLQQRFTTWLYTIAGNLVRNHFRWRSRHPNLPLDAPLGDSDMTLAHTLADQSPSPTETTVASEQAAAVQRAIQSLPEDLRAAIILCEWEEQTVAEAGRILGATEKAVESRLYRGRQILRESLKKWL